jgi:hypothetical protein
MARRPGSKDRRMARKSAGYWSDAVTKHSDALDIEHGIFAAKDPKSIARSLKRSAEQSTRRKAGPYQSAMSMLNFYVNRAGRNLPASQKKKLAQAKAELRRIFGRPTNT